MRSLIILLFTCLSSFGQINVIASDFQCVADGVTNNDACLARLRAYLIANGGGHVIFPAGPTGTYNFTNPLWLQGVKNAIIDAPGVKLRNVSSPGGFDIDLNCDYWGVGGPNNSFDTWNGGNLISSVAAGAQSVLLVSPSTASQYNGGDTILIAGYNQQAGGYPPNLRYNEIHKIIAIDSTDGALALDSPLRYSYDSRWINTQSSNGANPPTLINIGAPVAIDLTRPTGPGSCTIAENITFIGMTLAADPNGGDEGYPTLDLGSINTPGVRTWKCIDCKLGYVDVSEVEHAEIRNSYVRLMIVDKIVDTVVVEHSQIDQFSDCLGARSVTFRDSILPGGGTNFCVPRSLRFENSAFFLNPGPGSFISAGGGTAPVENIAIIGNTFYQASQFGNPPQSSPITGPPFLGNTTVLTVPTLGSMTVRADFNYVPNAIDYGSRLFTLAGKTAVVTAIYSTDGTTITIEATFSAPPVVGEVWYFAEAWNLTMLGNSYPNQAPTTAFSNVGVPLLLATDIGVAGAHPTNATAADYFTVNSDFNRVSDIDPGCLSGTFNFGYPGKIWIQPNPGGMSIYSVCQWVNGVLKWVQK